MVAPQNYIVLGGYSALLVNSQVIASLPLNVKTYGAVGDGLSDDTIAINSAVSAALAAGGGSVVFPIGVYRTTSNVSLPSGIGYSFATGASIAPAIGTTVTFSGAIQADPQAPIFAGQGAIAFTAGSQVRVYADWWGQTAVTATTCPAQAAVNASHPAQIPVYFLPRAYSLATGAVGLSCANSYATLKCETAPISYPLAVTGCTGNGVSPIVLTLTAGHAGATVNPVQVGQTVVVAGVGGNAAANGTHVVSAVGTSTVTLEVGVSGTGNYTSGGIVQALTGAILLYGGTGTAVQIGQQVGVTPVFVPGSLVENIRIQCVDATSIGLRDWCSLQTTFRKVCVYGLSGNTHVCVQVEGSLETRFEQCDFQGQGTINTPANYAIGLNYLAAAGSGPTTCVFDQCYFHYHTNAIQVSGGGFVHFRGTVFEASTRGFSVTSLGHATFDGQCWFEALGNIGSGELLGYVDSTSYVGLSDFVINPTGCLNVFTVAAGCKVRVRNGRLLGIAGSYKMFRAAEVGNTSDVKITDMSWEGSTGSYSSIDTNAITGEQGNWKTVQFTNLQPVRYGFIQKAVVGTQVATAINADNGNASQSFTLTGDPNNIAGGGRVLGMSWQYNAAPVSGSMRIKVFVAGVAVLDTGLITSSSGNHGSVDLSALSTPVVSGQQLVVQLTTTSLVNAGGDLSVDVYIGYGNVCQA